LSRLGDRDRYPALNKSRTLPNSKQNRDDLLIGDDKWITFVQHDWANVDWLYIDEIIEPLSPLFDQLEIHCVAECCGLDAISFEPDDILASVEKLDRKSLIDELGHAINQITQLTHDVLGSKRLNNGIDRGTLLELLGHIRDTIAPPKTDAANAG